MIIALSLGTLAIREGRIGDPTPDGHSNGHLWSTGCVLELLRRL